MSDHDDLTSEIVFEDLTPIEVPVKIEGKSYILREASGDAACKWRNAQLRAARMERGKLANIGNLADCEPLLVSLCLFEVIDANRSITRNVPQQTIRNWPSRVQKALYDRALKISGLDTEVEDEEQEETITPTTGSDGATDADYPATEVVEKNGGGRGTPAVRS